MPAARELWSVAAVVGSLLDGLLAGALISPVRAKKFKPWAFSQPKATAFVIVFSWLAGSFLSAVGVPLALTWALVLGGLWSFFQIAGLEEKNRVDPVWAEESS
jgi:hypothetical protein